MSITEQQSLIMHTLLYASWGLAAGIFIIGIMIMRTWRKKKDDVKKDINRTFKFL